MSAPATPRRYRVVAREVETTDTVTLTLSPVDEPVDAPLPGQFMMLTSFGLGEVPISISGGNGAELVHTLRAVGPVTRALHAAAPDSIVGVRGPFGTDWGVDRSAGRDLLFVAGGIGLAPLRPAIWAAAESGHRGRTVVLVGARTPDDLLFRNDMAAWGRRPDIAFGLTVDRAAAGWSGNVGLVTSLVKRANVDPSRTTAFLCGPEVMMRVVARSLTDRGLAEADIQLSLERNMRCGAGLCGHCQLGPVLICRDGPVISLDRAGPLLATREL
ncbi:MAG TPA: FAD/NAD(P)-binding protein [Jiangellaceae bacterium]|nr:FAD/NAD(P)-binding protein [Jiangellaceae bacterium]